MAELANIVAELRSSGLRWHTLQAVGRKWRHHARFNEALIAATLPPPAVARAGWPLPRRGDNSEDRERTSARSGRGDSPAGGGPQEPDRLKVEFAVGNETVTA